MNDDTNMYCIYHSRDLDGHMSAAIIMLWYKNSYGHLDGLNLIGWDYGDPIPALKPDRPVIMVDISFPLYEMKRISKNANGSLIWIDHHKSAIIEFVKDGGIENNKWLTVMIPEATYIEGHEDIMELELVGACELTWRKYFPDTDMPEIVRLLGCYDSFRHKGTDESGTVFAFQYAARTYLHNPEHCFTTLKDHHMLDLITWQRIGSGILSYLKVEARSIYKNRMTFEIAGYIGASINRERFNPSSYDIDYHKDGYDLFMCYSRMKDGRWTVSLYNENGEVDVSVLAKTQGGGGHARAAGFVTGNLDLLTQVYKK